MIKCMWQKKANELFLVVHLAKGLFNFWKFRIDLLTASSVETFWQILLVICCIIGRSTCSVILVVKWVHKNPFELNFSGLSIQEVVVQITISFLLILLNRTETPTTGGLETIFDEGKTWDATTILAVSVTWSLLSTIKSHTQTLN